MSCCSCKSSILMMVLSVSKKRLLRFRNIINESYEKRTGWSGWEKLQTVYNDTNGSCSHYDWLRVAKRLDNFGKIETSKVLLNVFRHSVLHNQALMYTLVPERRIPCHEKRRQHVLSNNIGRVLEPFENLSTNLCNHFRGIWFKTSSNPKLIYSEYGSLYSKWLTWNRNLLARIFDSQTCEQSSRLLTNWNLSS